MRRSDDYQEVLREIREGEDREAWLTLDGEPVTSLKQLDEIRHKMLEQMMLDLSKGAARLLAEDGHAYTEAEIVGIVQPMIRRALPLAWDIVVQQTAAAEFEISGARLQ
jgi:hypothetical protein